MVVLPEPVGPVEAEAVPQLEFLRCTGAFCGLIVPVSPGRADWRSREMCRRCFNVARQAYRNMTPRNLLVHISSGEQQLVQWQQTLAAFDRLQASGAARVHIAPISVARSLLLSCMLTPWPH